MADLERNLQNRRWLVERLRAEIVGPDPSGDPVDVRKDGLTVATWEEFRRPRRQLNGEEILWQDSPVKRYGAGILFPQGFTEQGQIAEEANTTPEFVEDVDPGPDVRVDEFLEKKAQGQAGRIKVVPDDVDEQDVALANAYRQSAIGVSFLADLSSAGREVRIAIDCATYRRVRVSIGESTENPKRWERYIW